MKRIINPFADQGKQGGYNCFGCSPYNDVGLKLQFFDDGEGLTANWQPKRFLEGYPHVVHGGIQSTLLDEIGEWVIYVKCETAGVTANLNIDFKHPLRITDQEVTLKGQLLEHKDTEAKVKTSLFDAGGKLCTEGIITYFIYPQEIAVKRFIYPGVKAFYEE